MRKIFFNDTRSRISPLPVQNVSSFKYWRTSGKFQLLNLESPLSTLLPPFLLRKSVCGDIKRILSAFAKRRPASFKKSFSLLVLSLFLPEPNLINTLWRAHGKQSKGEIFPLSALFSFSTFDLFHNIDPAFSLFSIVHHERTKKKVKGLEIRSLRKYKTSCVRNKKKDSLKSMCSKDSP